MMKKLVKAVVDTRCYISVRSSMLIKETFGKPSVLFLHLSLYHELITKYQLVHIVLKITDIMYPTANEFVVFNFVLGKLCSVGIRRIK